MSDLQREEERLRAIFAAVDSVAPAPASGLVRGVHRRHRGRRMRQVLGAVLAIVLIGGVTGGVEHRVADTKQPATIQPATQPPSPQTTDVTSTLPAATPANLAPSLTPPGTPTVTLASCEPVHQLDAASETQVVPFHSGIFKTCSSPAAPGAQADGFTQITYITHGTKDDEASNQSKYDVISGPCARFGLSYRYSNMGAVADEPVRHVIVGTRAGVGTAMTYKADGSVPLPGPQQVTVFHNASYILVGAKCDAPNSGLEDKGRVPQQTLAATATIQATAPAIAARLRFTFDVVVSGRTVMIGGSWTGVDRALTAPQIAADQAPSTGSQAGSGVEGFDGDVNNADGGSLENGTPGVFAQTNGDILTCAGAAVRQTRFLPPQRIALSKAGTYRLTMHTYSCSGERVDTSGFTVR